MVNMTDLPAVGYCRVSTDKQDVSLEAQEERIRAGALIKGVTLSEIVVDRDEFSGDLNRPGVIRVLDLIKARAVSAVIFAKLDRVSRSTADTIYLVDLCNKKNVAFISLAESLDTKSAVGRFFVRTLASHAEFERESIGERTRIGLTHLKKLGMPVGNVPYGHQKRGSNRGVPLALKQPLAPNEAEQKIVALALELRREGLGMRDIAEMLNAEGYRTRRGTKWRFQYVARMVKGQSL